MHEWRGIVFGLLLDASTIPLSRVLLCVVRHYEYRNNVSFLGIYLTDPMQPNQRNSVVSHADRLFQMLKLHKTQRTEAL